MLFWPGKSVWLLWQRFDVDVEDLRGDPSVSVEEDQFFHNIASLTVAFKDIS